MIHFFSLWGGSLKLRPSASAPAPVLTAAAKLTGGEWIGPEENELFILICYL